MKENEAEKLFTKWWYNCGSGVTPLPDHDLEAHSKRIAWLAFETGFLKGSNKVSE